MLQSIGYNQLWSRQHANHSSNSLKWVTTTFFEIRRRNIDLISCKIVCPVKESKDHRIFYRFLFRSLVNYHKLKRNNIKMVKKCFYPSEKNVWLSRCCKLNWLSCKVLKYQPNHLFHIMCKELILFLYGHTCLMLKRMRCDDHVSNVCLIEKKYLTIFKNRTIKIEIYENKNE